MRKVQTPVTKTVYEDRFVAKDGKIFKGENAEEECLRYEQEIDAAEKLIDSIECNLNLGDPFIDPEEDLEVSWYRPKSIEEVEILFKYYWVDETKENFGNYINRWIAIEWRDGEGFVKTLDEITDDIRSFYKEFGYKLSVEEEA